MVGLQQPCIWPVKTNITYPQRCSVEQAEEENREANGRPSNYKWLKDKYTKL